MKLFMVTLLAALPLLMLEALSGCCSSPSSKRRSPVAKAPPGRWQEASVEISYTHAFTKNGHKNSPRVIHRLDVVEQAPPHNIVMTFLTSQHEGEPTPKRFDELRESSYTLQFAPDAHSLAVSEDGKAWTIFELESIVSTTEEPFWCRHKQVTTLSPWPSSRELALEVLSAADLQSPAAAIHRSASVLEWPAGSPRKSSLVWEKEVLGASRYACLKRDDPTLRAALIEAYLRPDPNDSSTELDQCVGEVIQSDPSALVRFQSALPGADKHLRPRIDRVLKRVGVELSP